MKIATWNIGGGYTYDLNEHRASKEMNIGYFIEALQGSDLDVLALQEVYQPEAGESHAAEIAKILGFNVVQQFSEGGSHIHGTGALATALLLRNEKLLGQHSSVVLPGLPFPPRFPNGRMGMQIDRTAVITEYGGHIFATLHLEAIHIFGKNPHEGEGKNYFNAVDSYLAKHLQVGTILLGDFNVTDITSALPETMSKFKYRDVLPDESSAPTEDNTFKKPDHILVSEEIHCDHASITVVEADHYLCVVEVG